MSIKRTWPSGDGWIDSWAGGLLSLSTSPCSLGVWWGKCQGMLVRRGILARGGAGVPGPAWVLLANQQCVLRSARGAAREGGGQRLLWSRGVLAGLCSCLPSPEGAKGQEAGAGGVPLSSLLPASLVHSCLPGPERVGVLRKWHSATPGPGRHPAGPDCSWAVSPHGDWVLACGGVKGS